MHRVRTARWLSRALKIGDVVPATGPGLPVFLCPAIGLARAGCSRYRCMEMKMANSTPQRCFNHTDAAAVPATPFDADKAPEDVTLEQEQPARNLPIMCSGCGAFSQTTDPQQLGHFDLRSKRVRMWLHPRSNKDGHGRRASGSAEEDQIVDNVLSTLAPEMRQKLGLSAESLVDDKDGWATAKLVAEKPPVCDRCHNLMHYSTASSTAKLTMHHPTVDSLRETIEESPYKYNHIYHIIDAADFPMSLIPRLNVLLGDISLRSKNRRSRSGKYHHDRKMEMSFIITRSDLLGPTKEIVDSMMPYLQDVLRDALGRLGDRVRLGNLRCVSARRAWWTGNLKEDVWKRGGAGWMVGKVNVGKSQLFEAIYPKGRMGDGNDMVDQKRDQDRNVTSSTYARSLGTAQTGGRKEAWENIDAGELLPPAQPATNFPEMPVVSSLPGTTASPIRVPFGNGKGELIDLPGLARSDLELFVKEEDRQSLIMKNRIVPEQRSVKSSLSILLGGGLIRITPRTKDLIFLMYNFTPLNDHLTKLDKAIAFQNQTHESIGVPSIMLPGVGDKIKHAGTFKLTYDVTKERAGPLVKKRLRDIPVDRLPFRVLSVDILIEGVGYVEIVAQVRRHEHEKWVRMQQARDEALARLNATVAAGASSLSPGRSDGISASAGDENASHDKDPFGEMMQKRVDSRGWPAPGVDMNLVPEPEWPAVDVFSPEGRFVGSRRPIQGWVNNQPRVLAKHKKARPRRSMKGMKKLLKEADRRDAKRRKEREAEREGR
ncbi:hypothetical protein E4U55_008249 [Claviceps digitariae]|nr:hypothetical protein E4U55_008249 [Claviceps digitariae]